MRFLKQFTAATSRCAAPLLAFTLILTSLNLGGCSFGGPSQITDEIQWEAGETFELDYNTVFENFSEKLEKKTTVTGAVDVNTPGEYELEITCRRTTYHVTVIVSDTIAPVATAIEQVYMTNDLEAVTGRIKEDAKAFVSDATEVTITTGELTCVGAYVSQSGEGYVFEEETASGMYTLEVIYTDLGGNETRSLVNIAYDCDAPLLMSDEQTFVTLEDQTIESNDLTITPEYDLSPYTWVDNEKVLDSSSDITCVDEENHIWEITATATDVNGNTTTLTCKITVVEPTRVSTGGGSGSGSGSGSSSGGGSGYGSNSGGGSSGGTAGFNTAYAEQVLALVNEERAAAGLAPLTMNYTLVSCSNTRAQEIAVSFSHDRPDGSSCFSAFNVGYSYAGENIAAGQRSPSAVVTAWMNSSGHRANILSENFTEIAISCYYDPNSTYGYYWVQNFIG